MRLIWTIFVGCVSLTAHIRASDIPTTPPAFRATRAAALQDPPARSRIEEFAQRARDAQRAERCQTELPSPSTAENPLRDEARGAPEQPPPGGRRRGSELNDDADSSGSGGLPSGGGGATLLWILAAVGVVVLLVRAFANRSDAPRLQPEAGSERTRQGVVVDAEAAEFRASAPLLDEAQALAAAGKFAAAIHLLFLRTLDDLRDAGGLEDRPWWTSRRLLESVRLAPETKRPLALLIDAVESSRFAGRPAGAAEWEASAEAYRSLLANSPASEMPQ